MIQLIRGSGWDAVQTGLITVDNSHGNRGGQRGRLDRIRSLLRPLIVTSGGLVERDVIVGVGSGLTVGPSVQ